jgi:hypothetical protein
MLDQSGMAVLVLIRSPKTAIIVYNNGSSLTYKVPHGL